MAGQMTELRGHAGIEHTDDQRRRVDPATAFCGKAAKQDGGSYPARARAADVEIGAAGDVADRLDCLHSRLDVGFKPPLGVRRQRIAPAQGKDLLPRGGQILDDAPPRREIEQVELVDLRRYDQYGPRMHLLRCWRILDQLQYFVLEHDGPRGNG